MGQKPTEHTPSRSSARTGAGFESFVQHRAHMGEDPMMSASPGFLPADVATAGSPFHSTPDVRRSVSRRNPTLTLSVLGGLLLIVLLTIAMLFSSTSYVDESEIEGAQKATQVEPQP